MLKLLRYAEVAENEQNDEEIIDRKREFDQVARKERLGVLEPELRPEKNIETEGKRDPNGGPSEGLLTGRDVGFAVYDSDIDKECGKHYSEEKHPMPGLILDRIHTVCRRSRPKPNAETEFSILTEFCSAGY